MAAQTLRIFTAVFLPKRLITPMYKKTGVKNRRPASPIKPNTIAFATISKAPSVLNNSNTNKINKNRQMIPPVTPEEMGFSYSVDTFGFFLTAGGFLEEVFFPEDFEEALADEAFFLLSSTVLSALEVAFFAMIFSPYAIKFKIKVNKARPQQ